MEKSPRRKSKQWRKIKKFQSGKHSRWHFVWGSSKAIINKYLQSRLLCQNRFRARQELNAHIVVVSLTILLGLGTLSFASSKLGRTVLRRRNDYLITYTFLTKDYHFLSCNCKKQTYFVIVDIINHCSFILSQLVRNSDYLTTNLIYYMLENCGSHESA